jgi:hypothetical protein
MKSMKRKWLAVGVSICAVVLLVLGSLSNVVGYQTVQSSNLSVIKEGINQRELLFQTIVDIANNKEIQRIILKAQISKGMFPNPDTTLPLLNTPVLTKNQLRYIYFIGLIISKAISKSKIYSMLKQYQVRNQGLQKEIFAVIGKVDPLKGDITQLSSFSCDCANDRTENWSFPIICIILFPFFIIINFLTKLFPDMWPYQFIVWALGDTLHCFWTP